MTEMRLLTVALSLAALVACVGSSDTQELTQDADKLIRDNNLPAAHSQYEAVAAANPESVFAATGLAHSQMLSGDYDAAQNTLAQAQAAADKAGTGQQLRLRRAIVALSAGDLSAVSQYGAESQLPEGMVMAAEVHLADVEPDEAIGLLRQVSGGQGPAANTAKAYLETEGIQASVATDNAGGTIPSLTPLSGGVRLMVREEDADRAALILATIDPVSDDDVVI